MERTGVPAGARPPATAAHCGFSRWLRFPGAEPAPVAFSPPASRSGHRRQAGNSAPGRLTCSSVTDR